MENVFPIRTTYSQAGEKWWWKYVDFDEDCTGIPAVPAQSVPEMLEEQKVMIRNMVEGRAAMRIDSIGEFQSTPQEIAKNFYNAAISDILDLLK